MAPDIPCYHEDLYIRTFKHPAAYSNCTPNKMVLSSPAHPPQQAHPPTLAALSTHPLTFAAPPANLSRPTHHLSSPALHLSSHAHPSQQPHPPTSDVEAMSFTFFQP